jgi:aspartyl protease family protein
MTGFSGRGSDPPPAPGLNPPQTTPLHRIPTALVRHREQPQKRCVHDEQRMRFDLSSFGVMTLAVASALTAAWWLNHAGPRGQAQAAVPFAAHAPAEGAPAQVLKAADGHYWAEARIDGQVIRLMVDTGATVVALTPDDALRLGLRLIPADFTGTVITASGPVRAAPVQLSAVAVAGARVDRVEALVVERGLPHSLLGMSYLGRLSSFSATPAGLTLRP